MTRVRVRHRAFVISVLVALTAASTALAVADGYPLAVGVHMALAGWLVAALVVWRNDRVRLTWATAAARFVADEAHADLLAAVTKHHDQKADDLCWMDDNDLYAAAGLPPRDNSVGDPVAMRKNCDRFIANRCAAGGPWPSYAELEEKVKDLEAAAAGKTKLPDGSEVRQCTACSMPWLTFTAASHTTCPMCRAEAAIADYKAKADVLDAAAAAKRVLPVDTELRTCNKCQVFWVAGRLLSGGTCFVCRKADTDAGAVALAADLKAALVQVGDRRQFGLCWCRTSDRSYCVHQPACDRARKLVGG